MQALKNRLRGRGGHPGRRGRGRADVGSGRESLPGSEYVSHLCCLTADCDTTDPYSSETTPASKRKAKAKTQRKWGDSAPTESDMASLDYSYSSSTADEPSNTLDLSSLVDNSSLGSRTQDGLYEVKDWEFTSGGDGSDDVIAEVLKKGSQEQKTATGSMGALGSMFARLTGSKMLTEEDLKPVLEAMKQHLMKKNVAKEISEKVCEDVGQSLIGKKVGGFQSMHSESLALKLYTN